MVTDQLTQSNSEMSQVTFESSPGATKIPELRVIGRYFYVVHRIRRHHTQLKTNMTSNLEPGQVPALGLSYITPSVQYVLDQHKTELQVLFEYSGEPRQVMSLKLTCTIWTYLTPVSGKANATFPISDKANATFPSNSNHGVVLKFSTHQTQS